MSKLNLWQINKFICRQRYKPGTSANVPGLYYHRKSLHKNTPRSPCGERGAKTKLVFTAARCLQRRSYAAGGARYLQADLMLLTHAGCAFKDPRGRFGISYPTAVLRTERSTAREVKSDETRMAHAVLQYTAYTGDAFLRFVPLHCAVTAGTGQPPSCIVGLRCRKGCIRGAEQLLTCTGRPDGSGARSGR